MDSHYREKQMEMKRWEKGRRVVTSAKEEVELYKKRLKEIEMAFRYNLNLLADRDAELDIIEEQLRNGIIQFDGLSREKAACEEVLRRMHDEMTKDARLFKKKLMERENRIEELERRNEGNLRTMKNALDDLKREHREEKQRMEKNLIGAIQVKERDHLNELRRLGRKHAKELDQMTRKTQLFHTENTYLKKELARVESSLSVRMRSPKETPQQTETRGTVTEHEVAHVGTQTSNEDYAKLNALREQNDVLKRIIKDLKRKMERRECGECQTVRERIEETNRKLEAEIMQVKKDVERERSEEDTIMQNLESSVSCLKDKLLKIAIPAGDNILLLEERLNRRLEKMHEELEQVKRKVNTSPSFVINNKKVGKNKCV